MITTCLNGDGHARGLEAAERRGFMTQCEKGEAVKATSKQEQQKNCARAYMKGCLAGTVTH